MSGSSLFISRAGFGALLALLLAGICAPQKSPAAKQQTAKTHRIERLTEPKLSPQQIDSLLRQKVKYVFVLYQENRSFDSYFGTFPGADGLFSKPADQTPGFDQTLINTDGSTTTIHPFR